MTAAATKLSYPVYICIMSSPEWTAGEGEKKKVIIIRKKKRMGGGEAKKAKRKENAAANREIVFSQ